MTGRPRVAIVGASIGGLTTAETLRREGFDGEVLLIGDERRLPYRRPSLSKQILLGEWEPAQASIRASTELDDLGIEVRTSCTAVGVEAGERVLWTTEGAIPFDELVIATGSEPRRHPLLPWAPTLRTMEDALALRERLGSARRVGVVGAGVLGSEVASAARKYGAEVLLVGRSGALSLGGVGTLLSDRLARLHEENGVGLALRARVAGAEPRSHGARIDFEDGRTEVVDLLVTMIGGAPRTRWLVDSALTISNGVVCDVVGRAAPGISAVGDVAAWTDPFTGLPARVEHQSNAVEQAVAVALRIVFGELRTRPVPFFWSEIHGTRVQAYGWFDQERPLVASDDVLGAASILLSHDVAGDVRGVVGWKAAPRDFRDARSAVNPGAAPLAVSLKQESLP